MIELPATFTTPAFCEAPISPNLSLNPTKNIATKTGGTGWNAGIRTATPVTHSVKYKILERGSGNIMVGVAPETFKIAGNNFSTCGWYIYVQSGALYSQAGHSGAGAGFSAIQNGTIIEFIYDSSQMTLSISVDGTLSTAFSDVPSVPLYGAIDFFDQHSSVQLLELA